MRAAGRHGRWRLTLARAVAFGSAYGAITVGLLSGAVVGYLWMLGG